jgi:hypothetical protein
MCFTSYISARRQLCSEENKNLITVILMTLLVIMNGKMPDERWVDEL